MIFYHCFSSHFFFAFTLVFLYSFEPKSLVIDYELKSDVETNLKNLTTMDVFKYYINTVTCGVWYFQTQCSINFFIWLFMPLHNYSNETNSYRQITSHLNYNQFEKKIKSLNNFTGTQQQHKKKNTNLNNDNDSHSVVNHSIVSYRLQQQNYIFWLVYRKLL